MTESTTQRSEAMNKGIPYKDPFSLQQNGETERSIHQRRRNAQR